MCYKLPLQVSKSPDGLYDKFKYPRYYKYTFKFLWHDKNPLLIPNNLFLMIKPTTFVAFLGQ